MAKLEVHLLKGYEIRQWVVGAAVNGIPVGNCTLMLHTISPKGKKDSGGIEIYEGLDKLTERRNKELKRITGATDDEIDIPLPKALLS